MRVSGRSRVPSPPARMTPFTARILRTATTDACRRSSRPASGAKPHVVLRRRRAPEGAEPDQRQLDAEHALVGVELVGDAGVDDPAVAARDEAQQVVALEEVRAELRRLVQVVARQEREPDVVPEPQVHGAVDLVDAGLVEEDRRGVAGLRGAFTLFSMKR